MRHLLAHKSVTITSIFVLCITSWNLIRLYGVIYYWQVLSEYNARPAYILATALIWSLTGLWFLMAIWKNRTIRFGPGFLLGLSYFIWYWIDRLFIQSSPSPNTIFSAITTTSLLFFYIILLGIPTLKALITKE